MNIGKHWYSGMPELEGVVSSPLVAELAELELIFLCSLLPEGHLWYEEFD